ncbi:type IV pilus biogenesis protein PilM, partial [Clostridium sp.]|uniref:type IV pilus biogenesis protein PilM n=1 Tax=Clostridium sp. TaxID=1506 RepID=UPI003F33646A
MSNSTKEKKGLMSILNTDIKDIKSYIFKSTKESKEKKEKKDLLERFRRAKKVVAFDIGEKTIKVAEGSYFKESLVINNLIEIPTPVDVVSDGKIENVEYLAGILSFNLKESSVSAKDAICTTNSSLIINREIIIPKVEEDEYETVIRFEIQQYLPINLDDYVIQYTLLEEIEGVEDMGKVKVRVNVVSFPEKMSYSYYDLLTKANLSPYALDVT